MTRIRSFPLLSVTAALSLCLLSVQPAAAQPAAGDHGDQRHADATAAVNGLLSWYNTGTGQFDTTGWWTNANDLQAVLDYWRAPGDTGGHDFKKLAADIYTKNVDKYDGQFRNDYLDDTGWWGLAWLRAYDLTKDPRYLKTAIADANHMWSYHDDVCGGGIWWNYPRQFKNTITNELFIELSAGIHNRLAGDTTHLRRALNVWHWFEDKKLINGDNLVNDGLNTSCVNTGLTTTWTYNQGVVLGGLAELHRATGDTAFLKQARTIADAVVTSPVLAPGGILSEPNDQDADPNGDQPSFKGAFMRNLGTLNRALPNHPYNTFIDKQADSLNTLDRNGDFYGYHWSGPYDRADGARQHSAIDALVAAIR
ncbi:glycoside hydrolase family 76 protein [Streptomyces sp. NBC_00370]|uniref:glycoside hydrolase family 76 protein n=1 Tax=Streptomyces sp. NBC_00370 TaxID=2975728 RepID=UPI000693FDE5|nr:glycoside hydrolase family 76 protein [Streptomyces sp. NBC_00370]